MKNIISTAAAPAAIGPYSQATLTNGFLFVSGQIPVDPGSGNIECDDIKGQAVQSLCNMESILKEAGYTIEDVVKTTCFITDMKNFAEFNEVYGTFFKENCPARSCVAVKELPKNALCELEAIAYK